MRTLAVGLTVLHYYICDNAQNMSSKRQEVDGDARLCGRSKQKQSGLFIHHLASRRVSKKDRKKGNKQAGRYQTSYQQEEKKLQCDK